MLYDILFGFWKVTQFPGYTTILNGKSALSSPLCISRNISYTNVFAVPQVVVQRNPIAISSVEAFLSTFSNDCQTYHESVSWARPARIQQPASALTVTLTSFGSLARSATSSPSPPAKLQNPDVSATPQPT